MAEDVVSPRSKLAQGVCGPFHSVDQTMLSIFGPWCFSGHDDAPFKGVLRNAGITQDTTPQVEVIDHSAATSLAHSVGHTVIKIHSLVR